MPLFDNNNGGVLSEIFLPKADKIINAVDLGGENYAAQDGMDGLGTQATLDFPRRVNGVQAKALIPTRINGAQPIFDLFARVFGDQATLEVPAAGDSTKGIRVTFLRSNVNLVAENSNGFVFTVSDTLSNSASSSTNTNNKTATFSLLDDTPLSNIFNVVSISTFMSGEYFGGEDGTSLPERGIYVSAGGTPDTADETKGLRVTIGRAVGRITEEAKDYTVLVSTSSDDLVTIDDDTKLITIANNIATDIAVMKGLVDADAAFTSEYFGGEDGTSLLFSGAGVAAEIVGGSSDTFDLTKGLEVTLGRLAAIGPDGNSFSLNLERDETVDLSVSIVNKIFQITVKEATLLSDVKSTVDALVGYFSSAYFGTEDGTGKPGLGQFQAADGTNDSVDKENGLRVTIGRTVLVANNSNGINVKLTNIDAENVSITFDSIVKRLFGNVKNATDLAAIKVIIDAITGFSSTYFGTEDGTGLVGIFIEDVSSGGTSDKTRWYRISLNGDCFVYTGKSIPDDNTTSIWWSKGLILYGTLTPGDKIFIKRGADTDIAGSMELWT